MCGIAGSLDLRLGRAADEESVARMTDLLTHRGPDDAGLLVDPPVVLGHRGLSILDISAAGHQPMASHDGRFWITFNGEIYNYKELAEELRGLGHEFSTTCDTEVLLAAYSQWGTGSLERTNGIFAFALWDRERQEVVCARDRFGVKPLYYIDGRFRFAPEIKALIIDGDVPRVPNDDRVLDFLAGGITDHTEETFFQRILQLPAGCVLTMRPGQGSPSRPERWYSPRPADLRRPAAQELRDRLFYSVALRLRSDVPVGTTLSCGLDSTTVTAIATALRGRDGLPPALTFSSRTDDPDLDEKKYYRHVLEMTGVPNRDLTPISDGLLDDLDHLLWHMDEPFHSAAVYGHWQMSSLARSEGVTVLLDGQRGDEALAGYAYLLYPGLFFSLVLRGRIGRALREARARSRVQGVSLLRSFKEFVKVLLPDRLRKRRPPTWLAPGSRRPGAPVPGRGLLAHHTYGLTVQPLPMYNHQLDRNTMSVSLEARNPFLDSNVVACGLALKPTDHLRDGFTKWTLREAMRGLLPEQVLRRGRKQGFSTDEAAWIRSDLKHEVEETFRSPELAGRGYYRPDKLLSLLERHRGGEQRTAALWRAFVVERWFRLFIDPEVVTPSPPRGRFQVDRSRSARSAVVRFDLELAAEPR